MGAPAAAASPREGESPVGEWTTLRVVHPVVTEALVATTTPPAAVAPNLGVAAALVDVAAEVPRPEPRGARQPVANP